MPPTMQLSVMAGAASCRFGPSARILPSSATGYRWTCCPKHSPEAIRIARELGIPHIWIDALCIVQDNKDEWEREAVQMDRVYGGSQLTISAIRSPDGSAGCFGPSENLYRDGEALFRVVPTGTITTTTPVTGNTTANSPADVGPANPTREPPLLVRVYNDDVRDLSGNDALGLRGWTLQEQLLSRRLAMCMLPERQWACHGGYQTQNGLRFTPGDMASSNLVSWAPGVSVTSEGAWHRTAKTTPRASSRIRRTASLRWWALRATLRTRGETGPSSVSGRKRSAATWRG